MKKLMILAAVVALVALAAVPALAQINRFDNNDRNDRFDNNNRFDRFNNNGGISLENGQETQSGDFSANFSVQNSGDYASQCTPAQQIGNTGNFNNAPSFLQYAGTADDFEPGGIEVAFEPSMSVDCSSTIQQSSAASG